MLSTNSGGLSSANELHVPYLEISQSDVALVGSLMGFDERGIDVKSLLHVEKRFFVPISLRENQLLSQLHVGDRPIRQDGFALLHV